MIIYCDGPREPGDHALVTETRNVARETLGPRAEYHHSDSNLGLARSVIGGVTDVVARFGRVIVIEDDLDVAPNFLRFLNAALNRYQFNDNVYQVSGYSVDAPEIVARSRAIFLPFTVSWGWATWSRAWERFDPQARGAESLKRDRVLRQRFNLDGIVDYSSMLEKQCNGLIDSWAIRWYWSVFLANGLVLFPPKSLVANTGLDGSGTHGRGWIRRLQCAYVDKAHGDILFPDSIAIDPDDYAAIKRTVYQKNGGRLAHGIDLVRRFMRI